ncbi:MAG: hypothetical protein CO145_01725 [Candidatus Nealsonbacteria bacterium CG_4_9_14_3_um_filter_37_13]|uniref:Inositol-1-monophosphatase n=3 Tax=Candidatus Nealsoniibacteriota TaxID=1817911 RepID=A0A2H0TIW8_9BACT|nr:MAG: hypothetical protein COU43_02440 [Candidatus Nealsonbacteria bacterium CG10_big_fil_rev_8_21_14_0_10_37_25]PJA84222.1 MAG: hypothetical protein CO145_01725 [Candidatus Nealsonbacteria bacterium CG_4_9_14_3_um_filter_37_13]
MKIDIKKIITAAEEGSKILKKYFGQTLKIKEKSLPVNIQTTADLKSEEKILETLKKNFPEFNILTEEKGLIDKKSEYTFIVDPLDGTNNFILGIANFSVSIGLLRQNKIVAGVVENPILDQIYFAKAGQGSFLNNKKIKVNKEKDIKKAIIGYDCDYGHYLEKYFRELLEKLEKKKVKRVMINMSPALDLCRLATGKIEAMINNGNEIYDFAAGKLILREAGGLITDFKGEKETDERKTIFLATNGTDIHQELLEIL